MSKFYFIGCLCFSLFFGGVCLSLADENEAKVWNETIRSTEGDFQVSIDRKEKKVEVVRSSAPGKPPHLRVRILRQQKKPLEVRLQLASKPEDLFRYTGKADQWNGSLIGFELEWSFDKKTWKKLGRSLNKLLP
jgi:hypothetical protein